jgi:O-antigen ligase
LVYDPRVAIIGSISQRVALPVTNPDQTARPDVFGSGLGSFVVQGYLFLVFSRLTEYVEILSQIHLILIVAFLAGVIAIASGGLLRAVTTKVGLWLSAATLWMLVAAPFSGWVGGSVRGIADTWLKSYVTFFLVAGIIVSFGQFRKVVFSIAWATVVILVIVQRLSFAAAADDRIMLEWGTFGNSNDLATELLLGLPFCLHVVTDKSRARIFRIFFAVVSAVLLGTVLQTGSRGALLTIVLLGLFLFWKSSAANKVRIVAVFAALAVSAPFILSRDLKQRYLTLFMGNTLEQTASNEEDLANVRSANESTEARRQLLIHALQLSVQHPLVGVGFGQFPNADADRAIASAQEAYWHEVHNIFVLLMVENGVPAVVCFLLSFFFAFKSLLEIHNRSRKDPAQSDIARLSLCLLASLTVYFVCNNFSTAAYSMQFPILGGLAAAFKIALKRQQQPALVLPVAPGRR